MSDPVLNPPTPAPAAAWHATLQGDDLAHVQTRGWDKMDPAAAALEAAKAHRNAEKAIGIPADQILRKPKDASDTANWEKIHEAIGVPKDPKEYDFAGMKKADGTDMDPALAEKFRTMASTYKLPKDAAKGVAAEFVKLIDATDASQTADYQTKLDAEKESLKVNWGVHDYARNMIVAQNAAAKMGVDAEAISALEKLVGYGKVMEMFRKVGVSWGEDKYVTNQGPAGGALSKEQASARLVELRGDSLWLDRFHKGDAEAKREFENLTAIAARS